MTREEMAIQVEGILAKALNDEFQDVTRFTPSITLGRRYLGVWDRDNDLHILIQVDVVPSKEN